MGLIEKVLRHEVFNDAPPVLIDIGASGKIHEKWKTIAKYSHCIAFDADSRDFNYSVKESHLYKKLYTYNSLVSDKDAEDVNFYLTRSPYCSSLLEPALDDLKDLAYTSLFEVEKIVKMKTVALSTVLRDLGINHIDWFKSDSQGIDLRLFKSLPSEIRNKVIVAEFEPGIINSYKGEDKLHHLLAYMDEINLFWAAEVMVKGSQKISEPVLNKLFKNQKLRKLAMFSQKKSAGWAELTYFNSFKNQDQFTKRDYFLAWVFATIEKQHGFAFMLAEKGGTFFNDPLFEDLQKDSTTKMNINILYLKFFPAVITKIKQLL